VKLGEYSCTPRVDILPVPSLECSVYDLDRAQCTKCSSLYLDFFGEVQCISDDVPVPEATFCATSVIKYGKPFCSTCESGYMSEKYSGKCHKCSENALTCEVDYTMGDLSCMMKYKVLTCEPGYITFDKERCVPETSCVTENNMMIIEDPSICSCLTAELTYLPGLDRCDQKPKCNFKKMELPRNEKIWFYENQEDIFIGVCTIAQCHDNRCYRSNSESWMEYCTTCSAEQTRLANGICVDNSQCPNSVCECTADGDQLVLDYVTSPLVQCMP
jgi:hypothetical protein